MYGPCRIVAVMPETHRRSSRRAGGCGMSCSRRQRPGMWYNETEPVPYVVRGYIIMRCLYIIIVIIILKRRLRLQVSARSEDLCSSPQEMFICFLFTGDGSGKVSGRQ